MSFLESTMIFLYIPRMIWICTKKPDKYWALLISIFLSYNNKSFSLVKIHIPIKIYIDLHLLRTLREPEGLEQLYN
jgi:hypothetical protein